MEIEKAPREGAFLCWVGLDVLALDADEQRADVRVVRGCIGTNSTSSTGSATVSATCDRIPGSRITIVHLGINPKCFIGLQTGIIRVGNCTVQRQIQAVIRTIVT